MPLLYVLNGHCAEFGDHVFIEHSADFAAIVLSSGEGEGFPSVEQLTDRHALLRLGDCVKSALCICFRLCEISLTRQFHCVLNI